MAMIDQLPASYRNHSALDELGVDVSGGLTAQEALKQARLDGWNVRKEPAKFLDEATGVLKNVPGSFVTVRTTPGTEETDPIGIVGNTYKPIQNEEHAELLNLLVDESGAHFNSAGSTTNGSRVFISMKLPNTIQIGGEDAVDFNIVAFNSHDGSSTFKLAVTPLRVICSNMQNAALRGNKRTFSIRHTAAAEGNIVLAREALGMTFAYMDEFQSAMEQMMATEISDRNARKVLENVFAVGDSETDRQEKRRLSTVEDVMQVYREAPTNENIKGSTYGVYQAVIEYADHFTPVRGENGPQRRAEKSLFGSPEIKTAAWNLLQPV